MGFLSTMSMQNVISPIPSNLSLCFLLSVLLSVYLMAQVGSIHLVGAANDAPQIAPDLPTFVNSQPKEDVTKSPEQVNQQSSNLAVGNTPDPDVMVDDDDVQLVLSVPRRRRKKRKRYAETALQGCLLIFILDSYSPTRRLDNIKKHTRSLRKRNKSPKLLTLLLVEKVLVWFRD